jgi:hypothetical protein
MITKRFIDEWFPRYTSQKYPESFYMKYLGMLQSQNTSDLDLRDAIVALLHWKDGKANSYIPGKISAKPNTVKNLATIQGEELSVFVSAFREFREKKNLTNRGKSFYDYLAGSNGYWSSTVIPIFLLHIARPNDIPIVDQHVCRAQAILGGSSDLVCKEVKTWEQYSSYYDFWYELCQNLKLSTFSQKRELDMALWAFGEYWKKFLCTKEKGENVSRNQKSAAITANSTNQGVHLDPKFAKVCQQYYSKGWTQRDAIQKACQQFHVPFASLPAMYSTYAGRGFNEWRNKGWVP